MTDFIRTGLVRSFRLLMFSFVGSAYFTRLIFDAIGNDPVPVVRDEFWGPGSVPSSSSPGGYGIVEDDTIYPFRVDFSSPTITNELRTKLAQELNSGRIAPPLEGSAFKYGFNTDYLKVVLNYWMNNYDFSARENYLNRYPHFKTKIGGLDIHFQHIKPNQNSLSQSQGGGYSQTSYYGPPGGGGGKIKTTVPIIFCHGWPGSFVEYQKMIDYFLDPKDSDMNFEIVIPSIPGFGFSQGPSRPGMDTIMVANIYSKLMKRLGYTKYYTMGEDWGAVISTDMAMLHPDRVKATHLECFSFHPLDSIKQMLASVLSPEKLFPSARLRQRVLPLNKMLSYVIREFGYFHLQATKPDSVGVALSQSPSGLAAYILEKFSTWTNETYIERADGGLTQRFSLDELLDNIMVYWVSGSITSSMRIYAMSLTEDSWHSWKVPVKTPTACAATPEDLIIFGNGGFSTKFPNMKQFTSTNEGGHFASFEIPHIISEAALRFFNNIEFNRI